MSDFKQHAIIAASVTVPAFFLPLALGAELPDAVFFAVVVFLAANFPDLDTDSIPSRWAARAVLVSVGFFLYAENPEYALIVAAVFVSTKIGIHRGWTHKYTTPLLVVVVGGFIFPGAMLIYLGVAFGVVVHLAADKINPLSVKAWI